MTTKWFGETDVYELQLRAATKKIILITEASLLFILLLFFAIAFLHATNMKLRESEERYRSFFMGNPAPMFLLEPKTLLIHDANASACRYYGFPYETFCKMTIHDISMSPRSDIISRIESLERTPYQGFSFETQHRISSGAARDVEVYISNLPLRGQRLISCIIMDITDKNLFHRELEEKNRLLESANRTLHYKSITDPLTGLFNRRYLIEMLDTEIERTTRYRQSLSLFGLCLKVAT